MAYQLTGVKNHVLKQAQHYIDKGKAGYRATSDYSDGRWHPVLGYPKPHTGADITGDYGWPALDDIISIASGEIVSMARNVTLTAVDGADKEQRVAEIQRLGQGSGNFVQIKHNSIYQTRYCHLAYATIPIAFKVGTKIQKADILGYMGTTGMSTGGHLHFEVFENGVNVDPIPFLLGEKTIKGVDEVKLLVDLDDTVKGSADVKEYQLILIDRFRYDLVGGADGNFGNSTKKATEDYQRKNGLPVTGKLDKATRNHMNGEVPSNDELIRLQGEIISLIHQLNLSKGEIGSLKAELDVLKASNKVCKEELNKAQDKLISVKNAIDIIKSI